MSMLNYKAPEPSKPEQDAQRLLAAMDREIANRISTHRQMFHMVWNNPEATPDDIVAAMGTKASLFFKLAGENVEHIDRGATLVGSTLADYLEAKDWQPPRTVTHNPDGTVTLGA